MNLNQITIPVLNVPKAIAFYKKLGLELLGVKNNSSYTPFSFHLLSLKKETTKYEMASFSTDTSLSYFLWRH